MFTGIIETVGTVTKREKGMLEISPHKRFHGLSIGESIAVDGVCLTVDQAVPGTTQRIFFRLLPETVRVSTLGSLRHGDEVNLERSLQVGDRCGGHLLLGHVDGQGILRNRVKKGNTVTLELEIPESLRCFVVSKGPIGIDGISLTVGPGILKNRIRVHLVSHTLRMTTLGKKPIGARVNLEVDLVAKYLNAMLY